MHTVYVRLPPSLGFAAVRPFGTLRFFSEDTLIGATAKTLQRLMSLTLSGDLPPGARICDIGATQLFGPAIDEGVRSFLSFYAARSPIGKPPADTSNATIDAGATGGFLGDLLLRAGFEYQALDIFHGTNTILFDLNVHAPGPKLAGSLDLVMNFGTTEHVFNQLRAFQTIHELTRVGGIAYHDLPLAGYFDHALFRYDPLFFRTLIQANRYEPLLQEVSTGAERPVPEELRRQGYLPQSYTDIGIEIVLRRTSAAPFQIPLETSTSLKVDSAFAQACDGEFVCLPNGTSIHYGSVSNAAALPTRLAAGTLRRITRSLRRGAAALVSR